MWQFGCDGEGRGGWGGLGFADSRCVQIASFSGMTMSGRVVAKCNGDDHPFGWKLVKVRVWSAGQAASLIG